MISIKISQAYLLFNTKMNLTNVICAKLTGDVFSVLSDINVFGVVSVF